MEKRNFNFKLIDTNIFLSVLYISCKFARKIQKSWLRISFNSIFCGKYIVIEAFLSVIEWYPAASKGG